MDQTTRDLLIAAHDMVADEARFCAEHFAVDKDGKIVFANDPAAVRWCPLGAIILAITKRPQGDSQMMIAATKCLSSASMKLFGSNIADAVNAGGHAAAMQLFDEALKEGE